MGHGLLVMGAKLKCSHGSTEGNLMLPDCHGVFVKGKALINEDDARYPENIPNFGVCKISDKPCIPNIIGERWISTESKWIVGGKPAVTKIAACLCATGGMIHPATTGQDDIFAALFDQMDLAWLFFGLMKGLFCGDPININTGNFVDQKTDLQISGSHPLAFRRTYNALDKRNGALGKGWRHVFEMQLEDKKDSIEITWEDGRGEIFRRSQTGRYFSGKSHIDRKGWTAYALTTEQGGVYTFDKQGNCQTIHDINGNETNFHYEDDRLISVENICGTLRFTHDEQHRIIAVEDHTGRTVHYTYDEHGTLHSVENALGGKTRYEYDQFDRLIAPIGSSGEPSIINTYDPKGRVEKQYFSDGGVMAFEYDEHWNKTTLTEQNGNRIRYYQNAQMQNIKTVYSDGHEETDYDEHGLKTRFRDKNGGETRYRYDSKKNLVQTENPLGEVVDCAYDRQNLPTQITTGASTVQLGYDKQQNLTSIINPLGMLTQMEYDRGIPRQITLPDGSDMEMYLDAKCNITGVRLPTGGVVRYTHDALNRVTSMTDALGNETTYAYNLRDKITKVTNAEGKTQEYTYNAGGKISKIVDFNGSEVEYKYNSIGKVEEIINQAGDSTKFTYDLMWNVTSVTDPAGNTSTYAYDKLNRLTEAVDAEGNTTKYEYDPKGNMTAVTDSNGDRTEIVHDALDRQTKVTAADGTSTEFGYDSAGNLTEITNAEGTLKREFDLAGQLIAVTDEKGNKVTLTYTSLGKVASMTSDAGEAWTYTYHPGGQLHTVKSPNGETVTHEYDKNGNVISKTDEKGNVMTMQYDVMGRVTQITKPNNKRKKISYDSLGNITQITDEHENISYYVYSPLGLMLEYIDATGHSMKYKYDKVGNLIQPDSFREIDTQPQKYFAVPSELLPPPPEPAWEIWCDMVHPDTPPGSAWETWCDMVHPDTPPESSGTIFEGIANAMERASDFWNTHIFGTETVNMTRLEMQMPMGVNPPTGITGTYIQGYMSTKTHTGGSFILRTRTYVNGRLYNRGWALNIPRDELVDGEREGVSSRIGITSGRDGLQLRASITNDEGETGTRLDGNIGLGGNGWINAGFKFATRRGDTWDGGGIYLPVSPWDSVRIFGFSETENGNVKKYIESGVHMKMGAVYLIPATILVGLLAGLTPAFAHGADPDMQECS